MMQREAAETLALKALAFILEDDDRRGAFLGASGIDPATLSESARDPAFLGFVVEFLLQDDAAVIAFAEAAGCKPEDPARARAALPGGDDPHWT